MFGFADSEDIRSINRKLGTVEGVLTKMIHYVDIQASLINNTIDTLIETRRAVNRLESVRVTLVREQLKFASGLILTHSMHIIEFAFDNLWREWITSERLTVVWAEIRDKLPEETKQITTITRDTVHSAYGWIVARPTLADGQLRVFLQIPLSPYH